MTSQQAPQSRPDRQQKNRESAARIRQRATAGLDLFAMALETPSQILYNEPRRRALFGRAVYLFDETPMLEQYGLGRFGPYVQDLVRQAARPDSQNMPDLLDAYKIIICDGQYVDDPAQLEAIYQTQLEEEEMQTREERARESARTLEEKMARRNAKWIISALETASNDEYDRLRARGNFYSVWERVAPSPPAWIADIVEKEQPYGFVVYKPEQVERQYGHDWPEAWDRLMDLAMNPPFIDRTATPLPETAGPMSIHSFDRAFWRKWQPIWPEHRPRFAEDDTTSPQRHFRGLRDSSNLPSGYLTNTYIVLAPEVIPPNLLETEDSHDYFLSNPTVWVWACDADWEASRGEGGTAVADEDGYRGRVKVPLICLSAWFYAARLEGVEMKQLWQKAQSDPDGFWICKSRLLEEWEHEAFV